MKPYQVKNPLRIGIGTSEVRCRFRCRFQKNMPIPMPIPINRPITTICVHPCPACLNSGLNLATRQRYSLRTTAESLPILQSNRKITRRGYSFVTFYRSRHTVRLLEFRFKPCDKTTLFIMHNRRASPHTSI